MKASMMRSRGVPAVAGLARERWAAGFGTGRFAGHDAPPDARLHRDESSAPNEGRSKARHSRSGAIQPAKSLPRLVAAATALVISGSRPSVPISTSSAAAVVPPGEVTFCRKRRGRQRRAMQQFAGAGDGLARELLGERRRQAGRSAGLRHRFGQQEDIGRAGARHRGHRVHQRFVVDPFDRAGRGQQARGRACAPARVTRRLPTATVMPRPIAAGVFGMARTIAALGQGAFRGSRACARP